MTAILIVIGAALLLALTGGEIGDAMNMAAGHKSAPGRAQFAAGAIVVLIIAAVCLFGLLWEAPAP